MATALFLADLAYQAFYRLLCLLGEERAVRLGQGLLKSLPLEALPLFRCADARLRIELAGVSLPNPVILSSMYYDTRILAKAMALGFGAVTAKSITPHPRPGHPLPNLVRIRTDKGPGFVNCNGFKNPGLEAYKKALGTLPHRVPLIVSIAGDSVEEYTLMARELAPFGELVEINISSPNTALVYRLSSEPAQVRELFRAIRAATPRPLIVKISPDYAQNNYAHILPEAMECGINGVNFGNTRRVEEPRLSQRAGGLSGPELYENVLANVTRIRKEFGGAIQIIATGGIDSPIKAVRLLDAGATAVSYLTAFITKGPLLARRICDALLRSRP